ncbi:MAG: hypothetical protein FJW96_11960 [Actinobacteria bacterium]|nr:hypothetical protein [Actinomycetota bacterium]
MRYVAQLAVGLATSAIALLIAAIVLDRFTISELTFPFVIAIFTVVGLAARPAVRALVKEYATALASVVGLIAAFVTLLVTDLVSDGMNVEGIGTWLLATAIVWVGGIVGEMLLGDAIRRKILGRASDEAPPPAA